MRSVRLTRFHGFLLTSAVLIAIVIVTSGLIVGAFFAHYVRSHEEDHVVKIVQTQAMQHLVAESFHPPTADAAKQIFEAFRRELPEVFRIKVYDRTGRIVWSDEPRLIGRSFPDNASVARALRGKVSSAFHHPGASENVYEHDRASVTETYVPVVLPGSDVVVGVIETYKDVSRLARAIQRRQHKIWGIAAAMGVLLYVALAFVVWKASVNERRAIERLEGQNREQTVLQQFTSSLLQSLEPEQLAMAVVKSTGAGLDLMRASLYRATAATDLSLLADWTPPGSAPSRPSAPPKALVAEAIEQRRPAISGTIIVAPLVIPPRLPPSSDVPAAAMYLLVIASRRLASSVPLTLEIMLNEAAIALSNAELFTAVRDAHERLAAIMAGIADRMIIIDRDMRLVWENSVAAEAHRPGEEPLGRRCYEALGQQPEVCQACPAVRTLASGRVERGVRMERLADGRAHYLDLVAAPLLDGSGEVHEVLEVARDVTELVELEERLKEFTTRLEESHGVLLAKTEELERTNHALRDAQAQLVSRERMAAVADTIVALHHAILNPLTGILGTLQVLKVGDLSAEAKAEALTQAEAEARKIADVVRRIAAVRQATGTSYVGDTTMLDLESGATADGV